MPKPIAARIQKALGICYQADILTEKNRKRAGFNCTLQTQTLPKRNLEANWSFDSKLQDLQICHTDLNAQYFGFNKLNKRAKCWLIDFDKCGEKSGILESTKSEPFKTFL